jgi:6-phosphogluconolactonase
MNNKNDLQVFATADALTKAAANLIIDLSQKAISERGRFVLSLSGGRTPEKLYSLLAQPQYLNKIDWAKTFVFWGDERCVPLNDAQNNAHMAKSLVLDKIEIPAENIFPIPVNLPPVEAAMAYEKTLQVFFGKNESRFDLILLGLGENGHTASLFPGTEVLHEEKRWIKEVYVEELKMFRITMTAPFINKAYNIALLVTGAEKAEVLKTILSAPFQPDKYPAQLIKPQSGNLHWLADKGAAALSV